MWRLYNTANAFGRRPSDYFTFETELAEWYLDEACLSVGRRIENNLNNGKPPFSGFGDAGKFSRVGYRSVRGTRRVKKVKIKANGTL